MDMWNDRLRHALATRGVSAAELARLVGISRASMSAWTSGATKTIKAEHAEIVCRRLSISMDWLLHGRGEMDAPQGMLTRAAAASGGTLGPTQGAENGGMLSRARDAGRVQERTAPDYHAEPEPSNVSGDWMVADAWDASTPLGEDDVSIPFLSETELAAGDGRAGIEEDPRSLRFSAGSLRARGVPPESAVFVRVSGDSMEPTLPDGATVGVDKSRREVVDGSIYAVVVDSLARVKVVRRKPGGVELHSLNPAYAPEPHIGEAMLDLTIVGRVFWYAAWI